jgi:hypothetical protein
MTPPQPVLRIRRADLVRALRLPPSDLRVLVLLLVRACPSTARIWEPPDRMAVELGLPLSVVEDALHALAGLDFLEEHPTLMRQLRCVELGPVFLRAFDPPANLPVDRSV